MGKQRQRVVEAHQLGQLPPLAGRVLGVEQNVRAPARLDAVFLRKLISVDRAFGHALLAGAPFDIRIGIGVFVLQKRLQAPPHALVTHHAHAGVIRQLAVLDAFDAGLDRALDALGRVDVRHHIGVPIRRRVHRGAQFNLGKLRAVQGIVKRRHAAARHDLDLRCAQHQLFAHAAQDLIGAVGNHRDADAFHQAQRRVGRARHFAAQAEISMSRRLGNHGAAGVDARPGHHAFVDGALQGERGAACVTYRGETAHQCALGFFGGRDVQVTQVGRHRRGLRNGGQHGMPMHVDQAGHDQLALAVDDLRVGNGSAGGRQVGDNIALDQHLHALLHGFAGAIEQAQVGQQQGAIRRDRVAEDIRRGTRPHERHRHGRHAAHELATRHIRHHALVDQAARHAAAMAGASAAE
ncbi:hypothetical protein D3C72_1044290 [compost metagenome]